MKMQCILLLCGVTFFAGCSQNSVKQASTEFNELPPKVQQTVRSRVPNGEITDVNKVNRNGSTVYEIKFRDSTLHPAITVAQDGTLVKYDVGTAKGRPGAATSTEKGTGASSDLTALPVPVQKAIQENAPKADIARISRTEQDGQVVYEVQYVGKDGNPTLSVSPDGKISQPLQRTQSQSR